MNLADKMICFVVNGVIFSVGANLAYNVVCRIFSFLDWIHGIEPKEDYPEVKVDYSLNYGSDGEEALIYSLKRSLQTSKKISRNYRDQGISLRKENQSLKHLVKNGSHLKKENKSLKDENQHVKRILSFQKDLLKERYEEIKKLELKLEEKEDKKTHPPPNSNLLKRGYDLLLDGLSSQEFSLPERLYY